MDLLAVYFENLIYNFFIKIKELLKFSANKIYIKLQYLLFCEYFFTSPYMIIKRNKNAGGNFIYGETPILTMHKILEDAGVSSEDLLVDLGCGRGITLFGAYISKNMHCIGVDLIEPFITKGNKIVQKLKTDKIKFVNCDILTYDLSKGNVFFIAGTTFEDEVISKIALKLSALKTGSKIISLSQKINADGFRVIYKKKYQFSWGDTLVYIQEKQE